MHKETGFTFRCKICFKDFDDSKGLREHLLAEHKQRLNQIYQILYIIVTYATKYSKEKIILKFIFWIYIKTSKVLRYIWIMYILMRLILSWNLSTRKIRYIHVAIVTWNLFLKLTWSFIWRIHNQFPPPIPALDLIKMSLHSDIF